MAWLDANHNLLQHPSKGYLAMTRNTNTNTCGWDRRLDSTGKARQDRTVLVFSGSSLSCFCW